MTTISPDPDWLERLFDRHANAVRAYAIRRVGHDDADDVVAEVFTTAWRRQNDVPDAALPWLLRAAYHTVQHQRRSLARRLSLRDALAEVRAARSSPAAEEASAALADSILACLPALDAEVLRLAAWEELSPAEIALVLGISDSAARTRLKRARQRAQRLLTDSPSSGDARTSHLSVVPHL